MDSESIKQVTESDAVDVVETGIELHSSDLTSRAMCLVALLKLSSRFPSCSKYVILLLSFIYSDHFHTISRPHFLMEEFGTIS